MKVIENRLRDKKDQNIKLKRWLDKNIDKILWYLVRFYILEVIKTKLTVDTMTIFSPTIIVMKKLQS